MRLHDRFEWDPKKAEINRTKHRVMFEEAATVLGDDQGDIYHIDVPDDEHSIGEDRYITTGPLPTDRTIVLRICWTDRSTAETQVTRIVSARHATPSERRRYAQEIGDR
jgi:uncharacterized DUF497 family protein